MQLLVTLSDKTGKKKRNGMNLAQYPGLTKDVVESAEWRADVLEFVREHRVTCAPKFLQFILIDAQSQYMPANLADMLQEIRDELRP